MLYTCIAARRLAFAVPGNTSSCSGGYLAHESHTIMQSGPATAHAGKMRAWRTAAAAVAVPSPERWLRAAFAQTSALRIEAAALPLGPGVEALHAVLETLVRHSRAADANYARELTVWMPGMQRRVHTYNAAVSSLCGIDVSLARWYVQEPPALEAPRLDGEQPAVAALDAARSCLRSARALRLGGEPLRLGGEPPAVAALDTALCCIRSAQAITHEPMKYAEEPLTLDGETPVVEALDAALCCMRSAEASTNEPMKYAEEPLRLDGETPVVEALDAALCCLWSAQTSTRKIITLLCK